jgi:hypothetical protein
MNPLIVLIYLIGITPTTAFAGLAIFNRDDVTDEGAA